LVCASSKLAEKWRRSIDEVAQSNTGKIWLDEHRFGSAYPIRSNSYAQWYSFEK
jgi:hypothetical protein